MATKTAKKAMNVAVKEAVKAEKSVGTPKFPYTVIPNVLKKLLKEIPQRPKPPKMTRETLKVWGVSSSGNSDSAIRILKKIGLLDESGHPKAEYALFMDPAKGPEVLGQLLRNTYAALFETSLTPLTSSAEELRTFFNVHSGGGDDAMRLQIQTFRTLAEFASATGVNNGMEPEQFGSDGGRGADGDSPKRPPVRVDLHIHLPENKSARDYEAIIQDIGRYIYGRSIE